MRDFLDDLNDKQREAVTAPLGSVLVLAGAGSGKTRALTYRIAYLIAEKLFSPHEILALTFTNKAAGEMKNRITRIMNEESRIKDGNLHSKFSIQNFFPTMGTFHSVCARILRQDIDKLDAGFDRNFSIYDSDDSLTLVKQIVLELGLGDNFRPQVFAYYISACKNKLITPAKLALDNDFLEKSLVRVASAYEQELRRHNALDFDDLLGRTYELWSGKPKILKQYQDRFRYVLVDEYQDTNHVQYMLLKLLVASPPAGGKNIFVVGDDAQSIYGFRGANMQNILDFKKDYPKARVVMLEQNYRSTKPILDVANKVIGLNPFQYEKKLWTDQSVGSKVNLYEAQDEHDEARFVVERVMNQNSPSPSLQSGGQALPKRGGVGGGEFQEITYEAEETPILDRFLNAKSKWYRPSIRYSSFSIPDNLSDSVVLYRTHAQSRPIEEMLVNSGVPYQIVGGIKFYERREIKDTIAYLRLMKNPRDLVSLERVINLPARGIGRVAFTRITAGLDKYDFDFLRAALNVEKFELQTKAEAGAKDFFSLMQKARELPEKYTVLELMELVLKGSGYKEALLKEGAEGIERWENVEELYNVAGKFGRVPWSEGLSGMLEEIALMSDLDKTEEGGNKLTLMTLHSAKGLEWNEVFLVGLEEGLLPHSRSQTRPEEMAEEVRLAYVGMTRARKDLYLSYARTRLSYGELKRSIPSRILKAIPKSLLHKL